MSLIRAGILLAIPFSIAPHAATDFEKASTRLCDKIQQCAYDELESQQQLNDQMRQMIDGVVDSMCKQYLQKTDQLEAGETEQAAVACLDSLSALSCDALQGGQPATPACKKFEKMAGQSQP